jgi:hypothetical protein
MKSALELAMEKFGPLKELSSEQKAKIAEVDQKYKAKITNLELLIKDTSNLKTSRDKNLHILFKHKTKEEIEKLKIQCEKEKDKIRSETP